LLLGDGVGRQIPVVIAFVVVASATAMAAPAPKPKAIQALCDGARIIRASALPPRVPPNVCDLIGRAVRDGPLKAKVPPPGEGIYVEGLATNGSEEFAIETSNDGTVSFEHVGIETAPSNDNFEDARSVTSPASLASTNVGATTQLGEDFYCYNEATVWYSFTAPKSARYRVGAINPPPDFDGVIGIYQGDSLEALTTLECRDGTYSGQSEKASFQATAGETYLFQVGTYPGTAAGPFTFTLEEILPPANDGFSGAVEVSDLPFEHTTTFEGASEALEPDEPQPSCAEVKGTLWYRFEPTENLEMSSAAFSTWVSPAVAVYKGTQLDGLQEIACSRWGDPTSFDAMVGETYYVQVGADVFSDLVGDVTVTLDGISAPVNEDFADAIDATAIPFTHTVSINAATIEPEPGEPQPSCGNAEATLWYRIDAAENMKLRAGVVGDSSDPVLAVYAGSALPTLDPIACSQYGSWVDFRAFPGDTYYVQVGAMAGGNFGGTLRFDLEGEVLPPAPGHDDFADAVNVPALPYGDTFDSAGGTIEPGEPRTGCGDTDSSAWYRLVPTETSWVAAKVTPGPADGADPIVAAYKGSSLDGLTRIGCDEKKLVFSAKRGAEYYVQVARRGGDGNQITFSLQETMSPYEPCQGCTPPCEDDSSALLGFRVRGPLNWLFNKSTTPSYLGVKQTSVAVRSGFSNNVGSKNDCKLLDQVGARASYRGATGRRATMCTRLVADRKNVVDFGPLPSFVAGLSCTRYDILPGRDVVTESDIRLAHPDVRWTLSPTSPNCSGKLDLQSVITHEAGHTFGLAHSDGQNLTMYPTASFCSPAARTLGLGDIRGLRRLY
jgi:hypothetical protein